MIGIALQQDRSTVSAFAKQTDSSIWINSATKARAKLGTTETEAGKGTSKQLHRTTVVRTGTRYHLHMLTELPFAGLVSKTCDSV
jgi:hypothetical protein